MERDFAVIYSKNKFNESANFPKAENGQSWRSFVNFSLWFLIFGYLITYVILRFFPSALGYIKIVRVVLILFILVACVGYLNNLRIRAKYFEREKIRNDKTAKKLKKEFLNVFAIDKRLYQTLDKSSDKRDTKDNAILEARSRINNAVVLVNTRQQLNHKVFRTYTILIHRLKDDFENTELENLIYGTTKKRSSKKEEDSALAVSAKQALLNIKKNGQEVPPFSSIKTLKNGDFYIEAREELGKDPYYFDEKLLELKNFKETSEMEHSVPYQSCIYHGVKFAGFANYDEQNKKKKELAQKWVNEHIDDIQDVLLENGFETQFVPTSVQFRQSTAEIDFSTPTSLKAGKSKNQQLMEVAQVIDKMLDLKDSTLDSRLDTIHLSLALPNGKLPDGNDRYTMINGEKVLEDYTLTLNLEDVMRSLFG